jgi:hypothetical protein
LRTIVANCGCDNLVLKIVKTLILRLHTAISKPCFTDHTGLLLAHAHVIKFDCWHLQVLSKKKKKRHLQVTLGCLRLLSCFLYFVFWGDCFILLWSVSLGTCFLISFLDVSNNYKNPIFLVYFYFSMICIRKWWKL